MPPTRRAPRRPVSNPEFRAAKTDEGYEEISEEEEERPVRRGSSRPVRRAAPASRKPVEDEDDARPSSKKGGPAKPRDLSGGWGSWKQTRSETSSFADDFKVEEKESYLVFFPQGAPFVSFAEHWIDEMPKGQKKSYVCLGADCPLCDALSDKPSAKAMFNLFELIEAEEGREPLLKVWTVGSGIASELEDQDQDVGLEGNYFKVRKVRKGGGTKGVFDYKIEHVRERDLGEWGMEEPIDSAVIEELEEKLFDASYVQRSTRKALKDIVEMLTGEED